jgi:hypothetical protein
MFYAGWACGDAQDMTKLPFLHEPGVLHNLDVRYDEDEIYTYTGSILIAVRNPDPSGPASFDPRAARCTPPQSVDRSVPRARPR